MGIRAIVFAVGCTLVFGCATQPDEEPEIRASETAELTASDVTALTAPGAPDSAVACTPGDERGCCAFLKGCREPGDQVCQADGQWGACHGSVPR